MLPLQVAIHHEKNRFDYYTGHHKNDRQSKNNQYDTDHTSSRPVVDAQFYKTLFCEVVDKYFKLVYVNSLEVGNEITASAEFSFNKHFCIIMYHSRIFYKVVTR